MATAPRDIDEYLASVTPAQREALQRLRRTILKILPAAEECISYSMPAFRAHGHVVAGFLATAKGCSYYPFSGTTLGAMGNLIDGYSRTKSALHFTPEAPLPDRLVRQLIKARLEELSAGKPAARTTAAGRTGAPAKKR